MHKEKRKSLLYVEELRKILFRVSGRQNLEKFELIFINKFLHDSTLLSKPRGPNQSKKSQNRTCSKFRLNRNYIVNFNTLL